jgi:hypothetical protein
MTSKDLSQNVLLNPEASPEESIHEEKSVRSMKATVYDAVAGPFIAP